MALGVWRCIFVYVENVSCLIYDNEEQVFNKFVTKIKMASLPCLFGRERVRPHRSPWVCIAAADLCCSVRSPRRRGSAGVCRVSVWLTTKTVSEVQWLFSGGNLMQGESRLINSEITGACLPKCPYGKGISNPLAKEGSSAPCEFPHLFRYSNSGSIKLIKQYTRTCQGGRPGVYVFVAIMAAD